MTLESLFGELRAGETIAFMGREGCVEIHAQPENWLKHAIVRIVTEDDVRAGESGGYNAIEQAIAEVFRTMRGS